jgi:hypothetical protein
MDPWTPTSGGRKQVTFSTLAELKRHPLRARKLYRGEAESLIIPHAAKEYVDHADPPDECFFYATQASNIEGFSEHERNNAVTHAISAEIADRLYDVTFEWCEYGVDYKSYADFKMELQQIAFRAMELSFMRMEDYATWCLRNSNNRGRYLEMTAYQHLANGLLLISHALQAEPPGMTRYANNDVLMELISFASFAAHHQSTNKHDVLQRWRENVELWLAHDAYKPGISQYDLVLRTTRRAMLRAGPLSFVDLPAH